MIKTEFMELYEELNQLNESATAEELSETFNVSKADGHFSIVQFAKNIHDNLINNKINCNVSLEAGYKIKVECNNFNGVDDIVKNTKELLANKLDVDIEDHGKYRLYMLKQK